MEVAPDPDAPSSNRVIVIAEAGKGGGDRVIVALDVKVIYGRPGFCGRARGQR